MTDFSADAVGVFFTLLDDGKMDDIEDKLFREINKLAVAFEVDWLRQDCRQWFNKKILAVRGESEKTFVFDESFYMLKRLEKKDYMEAFVDQFGDSTDLTFVKHYLSNFESLDSCMLYPLLQLGGSNSEVFYETLRQSVSTSTRLSENAKCLLPVSYTHLTLPTIYSV